MNFTKSKHILLCTALLAGATACTDEDYQVYDTNQKDSVSFNYRNDKDELVEGVEYAFNFDTANSHTIEIPVSLMGVPKDYDRTIEIVPIADDTDMVEGINYTITNNIIAANAIDGVVCVNLLRDRDPEILEKSKKLRLTIAENDDLKSVGENSMTIIYSDIHPTVRPAWWMTWAAMPEYSYENAQLFFEYFYANAPKADINLYNEIIEAYGDYFVNATDRQGPIVMYESFIRNYVCLPMFREHPEISWQMSPEW